MIQAKKGLPLKKKIAGHGMSLEGKRVNERENEINDIRKAIHKRENN